MDFKDPDILGLKVGKGKVELALEYDCKYIILTEYDLERMLDELRSANNTGS